MNIISASDLASRQFKGLPLSKPFSDLLGEIEPRAYMLVSGMPGSGKSTFTLALADELANHGPVIYVAAEEGLSRTMRDKIARLKATHPNLFVAEFDSLPAVKRAVEASGAQFVILDSISEINANRKAIQDFQEWRKARGLGLYIIAHATKDGSRYKGSSALGHGVDVEIMIREGRAETLKNRYAPLSSIDVPFTVKDLPGREKCGCRKCRRCNGWIRTNPPHPGNCAAATGPMCSCRCGGKLHQSGVTWVGPDKPKSKTGKATCTTGKGASCKTLSRKLGRRPPAHPKTVVVKPDEPKTSKRSVRPRSRQERITSTLDQLEKLIASKLK